MTLHLSLRTGETWNKNYGKIKKNHVNIPSKYKAMAMAMAMHENYIQRVKIVINNNIIEQVTDFKY